MSSLIRKQVIICALAAVALLPLSGVAQETLYWDINQATAGSGPDDTPDGDWDNATVNWNDDSTGGGGGTPKAWPATKNKVYFAASTDATGTYTITIAAGLDPSIEDLWLEEGDLTIDGDRFLFQNNVVDFDVAAAGTLTVVSVLAQSGNRSLRIGNSGGTGTLILKGANTYTGWPSGTYVQNGTLLVNNASGSGVGTGTGDPAEDLLINNGATLGGDGSVGSGGSAFGQHVTINGILSPGASSGTAGTLDFYLAAGKTNNMTGVDSLIFELAAPASSDKVAVHSGTLDIGSGTLGFSDFTFNNLAGFAGGTFILFDVDGTLVGSLDGADLTGTVNSMDATLTISGNDIVLEVPVVNGTLFKFK